MTVITARYLYSDRTVEPLRESLLRVGLDRHVIWLTESPDPTLRGSLARWRGYTEVLKGLPQHEPCMLCDSRDVIFQRQPDWEWRGIQAYLEKSGTLLGTSQVNFNWVAGVFGYETAYSLRFNPIVCCGVITGHAEELRRLTKIAMRYMGGGRFSPKKEQSPTVHFQGHDQGVLNTLIYKTFGPEVTFYPNETGPVFHCAHSDPEELLLVDGTYIRPDGRIPCVIHQYDRL